MRDPTYRLTRPKYRIQDYVIEVERSPLAPMLIERRSVTQWLLISSHDPHFATWIQSLKMDTTRSLIIAVAIHVDTSGASTIQCDHDMN